MFGAGCLISASGGHECLLTSSREQSFRAKEHGRSHVKTHGRGSSMAETGGAANGSTTVSRTIWQLEQFRTDRSHCKPRIRSALGDDATMAKVQCVLLSSISARSS